MLLVFSIPSIARLRSNSELACSSDIDKVGWLSNGYVSVIVDPQIYGFVNDSITGSYS